MLTYNEFVLESKLNNLEEVNEGFKEIALSLLLLTGVIGAKGQYAKVVKKPTDGFVQNVEDFVDNKDNVNKLWDIIDNDKNKKFDDKEEYEQKLKSSIDLLKQRSDKIDNKKVKFKRAEVSIKDTSRINELLKKGWLPEQLFITHNTIVKDTLVEKMDSVIISYFNDASFKTGTWELTNSFKNDIKNTILTISSDENLEISGIEISTSTDKEPIEIGNKKLSENRAGSVMDYIKTIISTDISTTDDNGNSLILYDKGPDIYSKSMTKQERETAREITKEYRSVVITIKVKSNYRYDKPTTIEKIIEKEELVLIRITKEEGKNWTDNYQPTRKYKRPKSKKSKFNGKSFKCPQGF